MCSKFQVLMYTLAASHVDNSAGCISEKLPDFLHLIMTNGRPEQWRVGHSPIRHAANICQASTTALGIFGQHQKLSYSHYPLSRQQGKVPWTLGGLELVASGEEDLNSHCTIIHQKSGHHPWVLASDWAWWPGKQHGVPPLSPWTVASASNFAPYLWAAGQKAEMMTTLP